MADIRITDLVDEKVFEELEKLSEGIKEVKQQYIEAARELAKGLDMKISTSGDLEKFNKAVAESGRKAQEATEQAAQTIEDAAKKAAEEVKDAAKDAAIDKINEAADAAKDAIKNN